MMIATAVAMLRGRRNVDAAEGGHHLPVPKIVGEGLVVGLVTGLVGAGGGFLVVPALALLGGLPMPIAVGTSLIVIAMKSFAGLGGYLSSVQINWTLALAVTAAAVVGALVGARLTAKVESRRVAKGLRLVRARDVLGDPGPGDPPQRRRRSRGAHRRRRGHVFGLHPVRPLPPAATQRRAGFPAGPRMTAHAIPPRVLWLYGQQIGAHIMVGDDDAIAAVLNRLRGGPRDNSPG